MLLGTFGTPGHPNQELWLWVTLTKQIAVIGGQTGMAVDLARRPANFDLLDALVLAESEVKARIIGGLVASAADALGDLALFASRDGKARPDTVTVGLRAFELEGHVVARLASSVVEISKRLVLSDYDHVDAAVIVKVTGGQTAADAARRPTGSQPARKCRPSAHQADSRKAGWASHRDNRADYR